MGCYFNALYFLRAFPDLSWLIQTIITICHDVIPFFIILVILLTGFCISFMTMGWTKFFFAAWLDTFNMAVLGDFELEDFDELSWSEFAKVQFVAMEVIALVIALNAVIALMGDSYSKIKKIQNENNYVRE